MSAYFSFFQRISLKSLEILTLLRKAIVANCVDIIKIVTNLLKQPQVSNKVRRIKKLCIKMQS